MMKPAKFCLVFQALIFSLCLWIPREIPAGEDNQCVDCHTSAKKLIDITREIAKTQPAVSKTDSAGEG